MRALKLYPFVRDAMATATMHTTAFQREATYKSIADILWDIEEPSVGRYSEFPPLHETIFSRHAYKYTSYYRNADVDVPSDEQVKEQIQHLMRKTRVHFYEDSTWFGKHRNYIKRFVAWCDQNLGGDYYLTSSTISKYLEYCVEAKKAELCAGGNAEAADSLPEVTVHNHIRVVVAMLERLALWQDVEEFTKNLTKKDQVYTLYTGKQISPHYIHKCTQVLMTILLQKY
jgi:hypothetical protein